MCFGTVVILFLVQSWLCMGTEADAAPSSVASFNDSRCVAGGVCSNDPLLFTCKLYHVVGIYVRLPNGGQEGISLGDTAVDVVLPAGYMAMSLVITEIDEFLRNFHLTVNIANASLLNGGEISCDDLVGGAVMAACLLRSTCDDSGDDSGDDGGDDGGGNGLFTGTISGIVGGGVVVIVISGGISLLLIFLVKKMRTKQDENGDSCGRGRATESLGHKSEQLQEAIYDEPLVTAIDLTHNQAYGHVNVKKDEPLETTIDLTHNQAYGHMNVKKDESLETTIDLTHNQAYGHMNVKKDESLETTIDLTHNQAYGHMNVKKENL